MARPKSRPGPGPGPPRPVRQPPTDAERAFGARLREARINSAWTQAEAAQELGIKKQRMVEYETGLRLPPVLRLVEIVRALDLDPATLLPELFEGWERKKKRKSRK